MKISLDVFGGDFAPISNLKGAVSYLNELQNSACDLILVGDEKIITEKLKSLSCNSSKISIEHTTEFIEMDEKSPRIFKEKPNSSLVKLIQLVKDGKVDAGISSGNTGALLATSLFLIGKIPGIKRPAFAPYIPSSNGGFILCDVGANANSKPEHLFQFAIMAEAYIEHLHGKLNPKVGLLNIGIEKNKGNDLFLSTYPILEKYIDNFVGNIESRYLFDGNVDIVICDGFTGNIVLKLTEGLILHLFEWIENLYNSHNEINDSPSNFLEILQNIKNNLDHEEYGATPLLGINGIIMKSHGSSTSRGICNSLIATQKAINENLIQDITNRLENQQVTINEKQNETSPV